MKIVGIVLISIGIALLAFVGFNFLNNDNRLLSPIPDEQGIKVIFVSPTP